MFHVNLAVVDSRHVWANGVTTFQKIPWTVDLTEELIYEWKIPVPLGRFSEVQDVPFWEFGLQKHHRLTGMKMMDLSTWAMKKTRDDILPSYLGL